MAKSPLSLLKKALDDEQNFVSIFTARSNRRFGNELHNGENDAGAVATALCRRALGIRAPRFS